jgi:hypothetical protein
MELSSSFPLMVTGNSAEDRKKSRWQSQVQLKTLLNKEADNRRRIGNRRAQKTKNSLNK